MNWAIDTGFALLGLALICWAAPLSIRYNAWTTGLRERHPNFNPPPTLEWRARNTKIMTVIFRVAGVFFVLRSVLTNADRSHETALIFQNACHPPCEGPQA